MNKDTYFMHYRTLDQMSEIEPVGGATVAIRKVSDSRIAVSIARCTSNDVFNKKIGRTVSEGRLNAYLENKGRSQKHIIVIDLDDAQKLEPVKNVVHDVVGPEMAELGFY